MFGLIRSFKHLNVTPASVRALVPVGTQLLHTSSQSKSTFGANQSASSVFSTPDDTGKSAAEDLITVSAGKGQGDVKIREYSYSTANFHVSSRKLRMIGNQITGLSVTEAIRQMQFSAKKASDKILHSLVWARKNAIFQKQMNPDNMFIKLARVGKGKYRKRLDPKARGRFGVIKVPYSHMKYVIWEKQPEEKPVPRNVAEKALLAGQLPKRKVKGFTLTKKVWVPLNETKPVVNPKPYYNW
ncbi:39S ribosomal protein L22, mitochondrial [Coemansia sp. RSA 2599]|nr:39S ribosomal protein L22, mitochondrial [Coemansia sp. RSA 2598]KAJ1816012.1 39S ribosomal protein L22, mitochondrial [Coemansia sp. RSA 2599]